MSADVKQEPRAPRRHENRQIDGGWAWVVLFCSIFLQALCNGVFLGSGVYIQEWIIVFNSTPSMIGLIGSIGAATYYLCSEFGDSQGDS